MTTAPLPRSVRARVLLPFAGCTLIWGSTWFAIRYQLHSVPAEWSIAYRFALAAAAMFVVAAATRARVRIGRPGHMLAAGIGIAQFVLNYQFVYGAEAHVASGLVAVVSALMLVPNALLGRAFLGQGVSRPFLLGSTVALGGIALLFAHEIGREGGNAHATLIGVALSVAGLLSASAANVMQGTALAKRLPAPSLLGWAMLYGMLLDIGWAWWRAGPPSFDTRLPYVAALLYLAVFGSAVAFTLYLGVIRAIGPARAAYSSVLTPVLAMALSTLFEDYRWSATAAAGALLALGGLALALRTRSPAR